MKTFKVSNFRLFNSNGSKVDFKPVTILTGTNSSGKSSFVKAMLLLRNYLHGVMTDDSKNPASVQLDFAGQGLKLSSFDDVINYACKKDDSIRFEIKSTSKYAPFDFDVEYSFMESPYSRTKGELKSIRLFHEGDLLCIADANDGRISYTFPDLKGKLLDAFIIYLKGKTFQYGTQICTGDWDDENSRLQSAKSRTGIDITDWKQFDISYFHGADLYGLDKYDMTNAIRKYEETGILFYFPLLEKLGSVSKGEAVAILNEAAAGEDFNGFADNGSDLKKDVIAEFIASEDQSFVDYYKKKENEYLRGFAQNDQADGTLYYNNYLSDILGSMFDGVGVQNWAGSRYELKSSTAFGKLCRFMHIWQAGMTPDSDEYIIRNRQWVSPDESVRAFDSCHRMASLYSKFLAAMASELLIPSSLEGLRHVGNSFTPVQRLYSYEDRSSFVESINRFKRYSRIISQNKAMEKDDSKKSRFISLGYDGTIDCKPGSFTDKWLRELGIASSLVIEDEPDGLGFKLFLKDRKSGRKASLADQGHGITQLVSILLQIECEILGEKIKSAEGLDSYQKDMTPNYGESILAIEEPEVSLHPSMQSRLAMMFEDAARNGIRLIVETHSEYLVRRTQAYVAGLKSDDEFEKNPFVVYYFNSDGTSYDLEYMKSGRFVRSFGSGFFDEAGKSSLEILKREREDRG